jgi:hypothetical protein
MSKLKRTTEGQLHFHCPGCNEVHTVTPANAVLAGQVRWGWNGSMDAPTFSPSILVTSGHYVYGHTSEHCWCTYNREHADTPASFVCYRCHSFVRDGIIQFLGDCTHALANQTVPLPQWQEEA